MAGNYSFTMSKTLQSGHTVEWVSEKDNLRIRKCFQSFGNMIRLQPGGWFFEEAFIEILDGIQKFKFRPTDVIVLTFPRSGTTWTQEIVWAFLHNQNLDNPEMNRGVDFRSMEIHGDVYLKFKNAAKHTEYKTEMKNEIKKIDPDRVDDPLLFMTYTELCRKDPRVIKTHLPISLLPASVVSNSKIVYVARDPKDVVISRFFLSQIFGLYKFAGTLDDFINFFINEETFQSPYWLHLKEAWELRNHPNVLFLKYEEMKENPFREYSKINDFLGTNLTDSKINNIIEYTSFANMKKRSEDRSAKERISNADNSCQKDVFEKPKGFFRKGKFGGWKEILTPEQVAKINDWTRNCTDGFPKDFPYQCKE